MEDVIKTSIVYYDETGDDGNNTSSSDEFILTGIYMPVSSWQENYYKIQELRRNLKNKYGFHIKEEMHTKHFLTDKDPYRNYHWNNDQKREILIEFIRTISNLDIQIVNVIIDKTKIKTPDYPILKNALKYNIQRIENDSQGNWNYLIITDKGRVGMMRKTSRAIRVFNPIQSLFGVSQNKPIKYLIEDILEKDSKESYFIQICDFVSYFVHLYYKVYIKNGNLPNRVSKLIDNDFIHNVMIMFMKKGVLNLKASSSNEFGLVIYPK